MQRRGERPQAQTGTKKLPAVIANVDRQELRLTQEDWDEYHEWLRQPLDFRAYRSVREHLQRVARYHLMGLLEQKALNAQTYVVSALLITMDRERLCESSPEDDIKEVLASVTNGEVQLTYEEAAQLGQTSSSAAKIKLIRKAVERNRGIVDAIEVAPVETKDLLEKIEEREDWAF